MSDDNHLQEQAQGIATRAKAIIMKPVETWPVIAKETDEPMHIFLRYALPLAAIGPIASFIGGQVFGLGGFGITFRIPFMTGLTIAIASYIMALLGLWIIAFVANFLADKFEGKENFAAAFRLAAYSMTAAWIAGIFGLIPALGILSIVGLYSFYLFYKGAPTMMGVPQDKAAVYTVITVVAAVLVNIVAGFVTSALMGPAAFAGMSAGAASTEGTTIDLGEYGSIEVDESGDTTTATINVDGQEMTVEVPNED